MKERCEHCYAPISIYDLMVKRKLKKPWEDRRCGYCMLKEFKSEHSTAHGVPIIITVIFVIIGAVVFGLGYKYALEGSSLFQTLLIPLSAASLVCPISWLISGYTVVKNLKWVKRARHSAKTSTPSYREYYKTTLESDGSFRTTVEQIPDASGEGVELLLAAFCIVTFSIWCIPHWIYCKHKKNQTLKEIALEAESARARIPTDLTQWVQIANERYAIIDVRDISAGESFENIPHRLYFVLPENQQENDSGLLLVDGYKAGWMTWLDWEAMLRECAELGQKPEKVQGL